MNLKYTLQNYHWIVWVSSVLYSLWKFKKSSEKNFFSLNNSDFEDGWLVINRPKDQSDFEWIVLRATFKKFWPLLLFQVFFSEIFSRICKNVLPFFYAIYSIISLTIIMGEKATFLCIAFIAVAFAIQMCGKKSYCYALAVCALIMKNSSYVLSMKIFVIDGEKETFLFDVTLTWIMAKSLSFMVDRINLGIHQNVTLSDFSLVVGYCLYLPAVFTGPLLAYECFRDQLSRINQTSTLKVFTLRAVHLIYILFWYLIHEIMLHFIYSSSLQYYPYVVSGFDSWSLCGLGYALPVMFYLKYFVIYSLAQSIARFENFEFPAPPKCISAIHLSTYLWRTFDRGLYLWILKYLYHPLMQGERNIFRKTCALAFSFFFVCLWHNIDKAICVWTFLNFVLVSLETLMQMLFSPERKKNYFPAFLYHKRAYALFGTPHFIMMCISSTFFLSNYEIGAILFNRVLFTGVLPIVPIFFIMYCGCGVSLDVREWEKSCQCSYSYLLQKSLWKKR